MNNTASLAVWLQSQYSSTCRRKASTELERKPRDHDVYVPSQEPKLGRSLIICGRTEHSERWMIEPLEEVALGSESRKPNDESGKPTNANLEEEAGRVADLLGHSAFPAVVDLCGPAGASRFHGPVEFVLLFGSAVQRLSADASTAACIDSVLASEAEG